MTVIAHDHLTAGAWAACGSSRLLAGFVVTTLEIECVKRKLFLYFHAPRYIASHELAFKFTGPEDEIDLIFCRAHICQPLCSLRF